MKIGIIGGGAAGFFSAINIKIKNPSYEVCIYEKTHKILSKVKVSGGGRCNVTNGEPKPNIFLKSYPRGEKYLKKIYNAFDNNGIITWFKQYGVALKIEPDGRVFPVSDDSQSIIDCFEGMCNKLGIKVITNAKCTFIGKVKNNIKIVLNGVENIKLDKLVICSGGGNQLSHYELIEALGHRIIKPIPSLFTFNLIDKKITQLMGVVVKDVYIKILNTTFEQKGDLLITHWGLSGPAVIKLSAFAASQLYEMEYEYEVKINWVNIKNEDLVREQLLFFKSNHYLKYVFKNPLFDLPVRLWEFICEGSGITDSVKWSDLSSKSFNKLVDLLTNSIYKAKGKTTFKEEFVICGGVDLAEIDPLTMQSKIVEGIYFAGEVINVDGVTGGYNFQNAWSTAYAVSQHI